MNKWIVTAGSTNIYDNLLTSFIASLRETAKWNGKIGIMNYGLTPHETWTLEQNGIVVIPPVMKYKALIDDRFATVAHYFKDKNALVAEWDADIWFAKSVDKVFDLIKSNQLACTYDATKQAFLHSCVNPEMQQVVGECIERIAVKHGVLQGGFIVGDSAAWEAFSGYQDSIIKLGIGTDSFGIDMVALNLFKYFWPERVNVVGVEWNCLPEWVIKRDPVTKDFGCRETTEAVKAIHVSSPHRHRPYMYETYFPEEFKLWYNKFAY